MDYEAYITELGGKLKTYARHRFRDAEDFLKAAIQVVKEAGHWLKMTEIVKGVGISYPTYTSHFKSVRSEEIHEKAGVSKNTERPNPQ